jgi:hypothetical protein
MSMSDRSVQLPEVLSFLAFDVTGTHTVEAKDIPASMPVSNVAASLAASMKLPENVPWGLLDNGNGSFLEDPRPIGEVKEPGSSVTVWPKTHLG